MLYLTSRWHSNVLLGLSTRKSFCNTAVDARWCRIVYFCLVTDVTWWIKWQRKNNNKREKIFIGRQKCFPDNIDFVECLAPLKHVITATDSWQPRSSSLLLSPHKRDENSYSNCSPSGGRSHSFTCQDQSKARFVNQKPRLGPQRSGCEHVRREGAQSMAPAEGQLAGADWRYLRKGRR